MTQEEWVKRYVSRLTARGSQRSAQQLQDLGALACDAKRIELAQGREPDGWETPEHVAEEDRVNETADIMGFDLDVLSVFPGDNEEQWFVVDGYGQVVGGPLSEPAARARAARRQ